MSNLSGSSINMVKLYPSPYLGAKTATSYGLYQDLTAADQPISHQGRNRKVKQSQNLSHFSQLQQQSANAASQQQIPLVKQWFESLDLDERVLSVSTIDTWITETIKDMHSRLRKPGLHEQGKFRMISSAPPAAQVQIRTLGKDG